MAPVRCIEIAVRLGVVEWYVHYPRSSAAFAGVAAIASAG